MDEPRNTQPDKDVTLTPTLPLSQSLSAPSSPSSSQDSPPPVHRANAVAHMGFGLGQRTRSNTPVSAEEGNRRTLTQSR